MTNYRSLLKESWHVCKKYRFLWFFGFFSLILSSGGEFNLFFNLIRKVEGQSVFLLNLKNFYQAQSLKTLLQGFFTSPSMIILTLLSLVMVFLLIWLFIISQGAITDTVDKIKNNKESVNFKQGFKAGNKYFWSILGLNILLKIIIFLCLVIILGPFLFLFLINSNMVWGNIAIIFLFILFIPIIIIISFVARYALCYIVIEKKSVFEAIKNSFNLFIHNWLISIETAFILFLASIVAGLIFLLLTFIIGILTLLFIFIFNFLSFPVGVIFITVLALIVCFVFFLIISSLLGIFYYSYWVLLFIELTKKNFVSKFIRLFHFKKSG